jgi:hypothetical protein
VSNQALETIQTHEAIDERQPAALFLVPEVTPAERFYQLSEDILADHDDILAHLSCSVVQIDNGNENPTETLIYDARRHEEDVYVWQVSNGFEGSQKIWQLTVTPEGIQGVKYTTTRQGAFIEASDYSMHDDEISETMDRIYGLLESEAAQKNIRERSQRKHVALQAVAALSVETYMSNISETRTKAEQEKLKSIAENRLSREQARLQGLADAIGLTAMTPYVRPCYVKNSSKLDV